MPKTTASSAQQHVNIAEIKDGIVITKSGDFRVVIEVTPVNFALRSEEDQNVIVGQYQSFLNALTFPIQILVQSRRLDLYPYLQQLEQVATQQPNELLTLQATEYVEFIKRLATLVNIMDKKFYTIIPFTPPPTQNVRGFKGMFAKKPATVSFGQKQFSLYKEQLGQRTTTVETGLNSMGLKTNRLTTRQLIELYYYVYNPEEAIEERLAENVEEIKSPIIQRAEQSAKSAVNTVTSPNQGDTQPIPGSTQPAQSSTDNSASSEQAIENKASVIN